MADVTLEQLEELQAAGRAGVDVDEAISNMGDEIDGADDDLIAQLRYAHSVGIDERRNDIAEASDSLSAEEAKVYTDEETERDLQLYLSPSTPFVVKHLVDDNPINGHKLEPNDIKNEFEAMRDKIVAGDRTYLYDALLSQMGQMQQMSIKVNNNLASQKNVDVVIKYASMQMKLMAEQRRTIQALDDLMNPKRTTFVKEVSQHNHFPEKKEQLQNEKQDAIENTLVKGIVEDEPIEAEYEAK